MIVVLAICATVGVFVALTAALLISERYLANYGTCKVSVDGGEKEFEINGGCTLLAALRDNDIHVPSACAGKGTCRYCKVIVSEGGGQVLRTETPYLTRPEIMGNYRLACQVKVKSDMAVRMPDFLSVVKTMVQNKTYNPNQKWRFVID